MNPSNAQPNSHPIPPQFPLLQMASGYWVSQCLYVAAKLGIADLLKEGEKPCDELATLTQTHPDALYRLLRALASLSIFEETQPRCFQLTPLATYLQTDIPNSVRSFVLMLGDEHYQAWGNLWHGIKTGECAFENLYKMPIFEYYHQNLAAGKVFEDAMTDVSVVEIDAILKAYDFSGIKTLVDVAGGYGSLLATILQINPAMQGILLDLPEVIDKASELLKKMGILDRCQLVGGSFFEIMPSEGDAYLFKHIIHNWPDEPALKILQNCHQAIKSQAKILLIEQVIPPGNEPFPGKLLDINMLVMCGGKERTAAEYQALLEAAGFEFCQIISTPSDVSIIEAAKP